MLKETVNVFHLTGNSLIFSLKSRIFLFSNIRLKKIKQILIKLPQSFMFESRRVYVQK